MDFLNIRSFANSHLVVEPEITTLVGENETGKSNLLLAINKFRPDEQFEYWDYHETGTGVPEIKLTFELDPDEDGEVLDLIGATGAARRVKQLVIRKVAGERNGAGKSKAQYILDKPKLNTRSSSLYREAVEGPLQEVAAAREDDSADNDSDDEGAGPNSYTLSEEELSNLQSRIIHKLVESLPRIEYFPGHKTDKYEYVPNDVLIRDLDNRWPKYQTVTHAAIGGTTKDENPWAGKSHRSHRLERGRLSLGAWEARQTV